MFLEFVSVVQWIRDVFPQGGGAAALAGTRRVALGPGCGAVG